MPWLVIHITMPLMLLAAVGLEPVVVSIADFAKIWLAKRKAERQILAKSANGDGNAAFRPELPSDLRIAGTVVGFILAILALLPTVHNMYEVSYIHAADAPH